MALTQTRRHVLASAQTAVGASSAISLRGMTTGMLEVSGISSDTILLQARIGQDMGWHTYGITNVTNPTAAVSASIVTDGLYMFNIAGLADIRSNVTIYGSGTLNVNVRLTDQ